MVMKILFLSAYYPPQTRGGAEISTYLIAEGLKKQGHTVEVITEGYEGIRGLTAKPLLEKRWARQLAARLREKVNLASYDIVHAHDFRTAQILAELNLGGKAVVTIRDYWPISGTTNYVLADGEIGSDSKWPEVWTKNPRVLEASLLRKPFRVWQYWYNLGYRREVWQKLSRRIYISYSQRKLIEGVLGEGSKDKVIYNPVESGEEGLVKENFNQVLYVGRVEFYKGVGLLLQAWPEVVRVKPQAKLVVVGEGAQKEEYEQWVKKQRLEGTVKFAGRVENKQLQDFYHEAGVVVAPGIWIEPFGRTVAEAMAVGKLVVAAKAGGPVEIIKQNETGLLCQRNSREDLTRVLIKALNLEAGQREGIQQAARSWVRENLGQVKIATEYEQFYRSSS
jgi:glycosyltransferase involved in cell wall biosynthesis